MTSEIKIAAVIVGAGSGTRLGGNIPKQYQLIDHNVPFKNVYDFLNTTLKLREY